MNLRVTQIMLAAAAFVVAGIASAGPITTFKFENQDPDTLTPLGNFNTGSCINPTSAGISGQDFCTINNDEGFDYLKDGVSLNVLGFTGSDFGSLVQDRRPNDSGLGVLSPGETNADDQVQLFNLAGGAVNESILFDFDGLFELVGIDFNAGADNPCANPGGEGVCGSFNLTVDGNDLGDFTAVDDMPFANLLGSNFLITALGDTEGEGGFAIGNISVAQVPEPATTLLLLAGLAGLGASRRRLIA